MHVSRWVVLIAVVGIAIGSNSASGAIDMPAGSKVWMKMEASPCPDSEGDDCLGSNEAGPNPPNGIPLTTFGSGNNTATGYAEVLPNSIRIYAHGDLAIGVWASFEDTYTIVGSAAGPFNIPVAFRVTGVAKSDGANCPSSICHQLLGANSFAKIGTFNTHTDGNFSEDIRVTAFDAAASATVLFPTEAASTQFTRPFDITATYTVLNVNVGDSFTLAYSTKARASRGEFDMLGPGGVVSFDLPSGVQLVSALAQSLLPDPGDYNSNGSVDAADYVLWRKGGPLANEIDNPGTVNAQDYTEWRARFGNPAGGGASANANAAVPEPATLVLLMITASAWCLRQGRAA